MDGYYPSLSVRDLVAACVRGDANAWEELVARTQPAVARACLRVAQSWGEYSAAVVEELVQNAYTRLVEDRVLDDFVPRHPDSLFNLLRLVATRVSHNHFREARAAKRGGSAERLDPDSGIEGALAATAPSLDDRLLLRQVEASVEEFAGQDHVNRDLLIFQLYYGLGLTTAAIASIPCVDLSAKGVESVLSRLARLTRKKLTVTKRGSAALGDD
ncbi:MAG: RNA polymerase sigma factor [Terriglobales bacterium]